MLMSLPLIKGPLVEGEVASAAPPDPLNTYPESLWPSRRWRVSRPSRPCPLCHSPRALGDRRPVPRSPLEGLGWGQGGRAGGSPCSERESRSPCFRNHWPSTLPVTEKAQQEPHMPYKRQTESGWVPSQPQGNSRVPPSLLMGPTWFLTLVTAPLSLQSHSGGAGSLMDLARRIFFLGSSFRRGFR